MATVLVLQAVAEALTVAVVLRLDMLPAKYVAVLIGAMTLLLILMGLFVFLPVKGKVGAARRITACVLALLIVVGCGFAANMASTAYDTIHQVTTPQVETNAQDVYIFVRTEDTAQSLADTKGYTFAAIENYNTTNTELVISQIHDKIYGNASGIVSVAYYARNTLLADALLTGKVDALIMNGASAALLIGEEGYEDFFEKVRILVTIPFGDLQQEEETETTQQQIEQDITNTPFAVYISGIDIRGSKLGVSRSDVNILAVVNPVSKQVLLLNTPRDYYVPNPAGNGALDKLTHCGSYGVDCTMEVLENLYGLEIQHYGRINFTGFERLIDAVGGITFYSDQSFQARDTYIQKGENYLNGAQALDLARERFRVPDGDHGRGRNQMKVITALIEKMTNGTTIITKYTDILASLGDTFKTDLEMSDISKLVKMQLTDMAKWNISTFAVYGTDGSEKTYSDPTCYAYVMYPDEGVVKYAGALVQKVLNGDILTQEDLTYSG